MQKIHDDLLTARLQRALDIGTDFLYWEELYRWYDVKKIASRTYRDLIERWSELKTAKGDASGALQTIDGSGGIWIFSENYLKSMKERAEKEDKK